MSDNELDAELLALAGGNDSGSEELDQKPASPSSSSPVASPPVKTAKARPAKVQKGVAQKKSAKAPRGFKQRPKDESDEEGDASPTHSAPDSLGSGAMSESEDDTVVPLKTDDGPLFPVDGKFYSEKDKVEILGMSEINREEILAERAQLLERQTQDQHLRRLLQAREKDAADKKKRKAGNVELEESPRKGTRQKVKAAENLEAYKRQRERRNDQRKQDEERKNRDRDSPDQENNLSDADAEGESDVEWDDKAKAPSTRDDPIPELRDYERVRVGRSNFAKVCFYPGFDDAIKGCFCRINIGPDRNTGQNQYRMTQIKGFTTGKLYAMEGTNGKPFHTDQYAVVAHGKAEKEWPFLACSDGRITEAEFDRYKRALVTDNLRLPTMSFVSAKLDGINKLLNHVWTNEEITEKLRRSGVLAAKYSGSSRTKLLGDRERALETGDEAVIAKIDTQLAALDGPKLAFGTSLTSNASKPPAAPQGATQQERLAAINKANRQAYNDSLRKAQLAEKRAEREAQEKIARGEAQANPFARVKTRAKVHHEAPDSNGLQIPSGKALDDLFGEGSDISRAATPKPGNGTSTPKTNRPAMQVTGIAGLKKRNMDDEILSSIDLGIDIDI